MFGCQIPVVLFVGLVQRPKGRQGLLGNISLGTRFGSVSTADTYRWQRIRLPSIHVQWCYHGEWRSFWGSNVTWTNSWSRVWNHETTTLQFEWGGWGDTPIINTNMEHSFIATLLDYRVCLAVVYLSSHFKQSVEQQLFADWTLHKTWRIELNTWWNIFFHENNVLRTSIWNNWVTPRQTNMTMEKKNNQLKMYLLLDKPCGFTIVMSVFVGVSIIITFIEPG